MRVAKELRKEELQAFFRACKSNGVSVSSTPRPHQLGSVIIGVNGERYRLTSDMRIPMEQCGTSDTVPGMSVSRLGSRKTVLRRNVLRKKRKAKRPFK